MKTLLLTVEYAARASYYDDWRDAFVGSAEFDVTALNIFTAEGRKQAARAIPNHDLIVALHACNSDTLAYVRPLDEALKARRGKLVCFIGNELNIPWIPFRDKRDWVRAVGADIVCTQFLQDAGNWMYEGTGAKVLPLTHAFNEAVFTPQIAQADRRIDIGARSFRYTPYLGDDSRNRLYDFFASPELAERLKLDLSQEDRFDRQGWAALLNRCKATIATEAGSPFFERDDATVLAIRDYLRSRSGGLTIGGDSALHKIARRLPQGVKQKVRRLLGSGVLQHEAIAAEKIPFDEIWEKFWSRRKPAPVYMRCISSRHFDAAGTKTVQILTPGRYNDVLRAGEHYLELAEDFSNIEEVLDALADLKRRERITDAAYEHVRANHTYTHRLARLAENL